MPSTRKRRAKDRRSRQADLMSDVEKLDVMLGLYSRNEIESNSEERNAEAVLESNSAGDNTECDDFNDFRSLLNSNSRENSDATIEILRLVNSEVSRKTEELKKRLELSDDRDLKLNDH